MTAKQRDLVYAQLMLKWCRTIETHHLPFEVWLTQRATDPNSLEAALRLNAWALGQDITLLKFDMRENFPALVTSKELEKMLVAA